MPPRHRALVRARRAAAAETTPLLPGQSSSPQREDAIRWQETAHHLIPYAIPQTWRLRLIALLSVLCVITAKLCALLPPLAYKLAVDTLTSNLLPGAVATVPYAAIALFIGGKIAAQLFGGLRDYTYGVVAATCTRRFSVAVFTHMQNLSLAFHLQRKTGEVLKIMDRGVNSIDTVVNTVVFTLFPT